MVLSLTHSGRQNLTANKMNWKARLLYSQNWNIGFVEQSMEDLLKRQQLGDISWMKHGYKDRWFADPFIYKVTDNEIIVFVEECLITDSPKGILCELHVDRKSKRLFERFVLLELGTHLSYPAIIEHNGKTYVYPENGASGKLSIYEYDEAHHKLINPVCILEETVADSTILHKDGIYNLIATHSANSQENAFLYQSESLFGPFTKCYEKPVQSRRDCSRPAGNWMNMSEKTFRPAQDCSERYGGGVNMMKVDSLSPYSEQVCFHISPLDFRYNLGIHTINESLYGGILVVDGYGYLHPVASRVWNVLASIKQRFLRR